MKAKSRVKVANACVPLGIAGMVWPIWWCGVNGGPHLAFLVTLWCWVPGYMLSGMIAPWWVHDEANH